MDLQAFYLQAAEAAATEAGGGGGVVVEEPRIPSRAAALLRQAVRLGAAAAAADAAERLPRRAEKTLGGGAAAAGMVAGKDDGARVVRGGGSLALARDLICPECGKAFQSDKAMYGHLRAHPERRYKGSSRPGTPAAAAAGDARPRKQAPPRKEVPELLPIKWPVTARRSRTPTIASRPLSAEPAAVILLEPPRGVDVDPVPLQMVPPEPPVLLLEPPRSEEEEAAMVLMELYRGGAPAPPEPAEDQQMHVDAGHQMPRADQLALPAPPDHAAHASHHAPVEHIFGIIVGPQEAEAEQSNNATAAAAAAASKGKKLMEPEPVNSGALALFRDKKDKKDKLLVSPAGPSKRPKKRPLQDPDQRQPPPVENRLPPPLRRIPSPASDRKFPCPMANCFKMFPTHQALGGHMANHNRELRSTAAQNMNGLAAAHAFQNIVAHHQLRQDALHGENVPPPVRVSKAPKSHSCSRCDLIFPTGQALGGHMRKHWLEEKMRAAPATARPVPPAAPATARAVPILAPAGPANTLAVPVAAVVAPANALLAVQAAAPAAFANALLMVPIAAAALPNGEPGRDFQFDLNEMPME